jgi:hypothetical protein
MAEIKGLFSKKCAFPYYVLNKNSLNYKSRGKMDFWLKGMSAARKYTALSLWGVFVIFPIMIFLVGCGDIFQKKPTEIESRAILDELEQVRENPNVINPMPDIYRGPSKRMTVENGVKVFYFAKNTSVVALAENVKELGFNVSQNSATNQLILHCPDNDQADKVLEYLKQVDVAPIQVNIDCLILERFGDITKDWESSMLIDNLFGEGIAVGQNKTGPLFPGASIRESKRSDFGFNLGYNNNAEVGHRVKLAIDILISRGYLKILLNPSLETLNGKTAKVEIRDNAPIPKIVTAPKRDGSGITGTESYVLTDYKMVSDSLEVTPCVFADGSIGLKTTIIIGSKSKPEGVTQTSIITERSIEVAENRIDPGKSLVIGGMRKSEIRSVVRGVPFLQDIPILGVLFSSKDFEESATEIIFILTPSISSGGMEYSKMAADLREKQRMIEVEDRGLSNVFGDPLGNDLRTQDLVEQSHKSEAEMIKAQRETIAAQRDAKAQRWLADQSRQDAARLKLQSELAQQQAETARKQIEQAKTATAMAWQQTEAQKQRIAGLEQEMTILKREAEKAAQEAQEASQQAQRDEQKAADLDAQAKQATQAAEKAQQEAEQFRRQAEEIEKQRQAEAAAEVARKAQVEAEEKARQEAQEKARQEAAAAAASQSQAVPAPAREPNAVG